MSSVESKKIVEIKKELINSEWTQGAVQMLLERMEKNIAKPDCLKYSSLVDKLAWNKIAFKSFTSEECRKKWNLISKEIRKFRTLSEMVTDAQEYIKDPFKGQIKKHPDYPKRPLTPYFQFFMEKRDRFATKHPKMSNLEVTAELSSKYRSLTPKKKEKYITNWQKESVLFRSNMKQFREDHPGYFKKARPKAARTPVKIFKTEYLEDYAKSHPELSRKDCLEALTAKYRELSDEIKQSYIIKALKEQEENMIDLQKYMENNPTVPKAPVKSVLTKKEQKLKDQLSGKPQRPPSNGYNLFCTETMPTLTGIVGQKRIVECGRLWHLLNDTEKTGFQVRYLQLKDQHEKAYAAYFNKLSPEEQATEEELTKKKKRNPQTTTMLTNNKPAPVKKEKMSSDEEELHLEDSSSDASDESMDDGGDESSTESDSSDEEKNNDDEKEDKNSDDENTNGVITKVPIPARPTTPFSALFLHQKANRKKIEKQYPNLSDDEITRLLARRYHELPEHKRHKYLLKEKEQKAIYNEKMQQYLKNMNNSLATGNGVKPTQLEPVTGEQLYHEKNLTAFTNKHNGNKDKVEKALRDSWGKLNKTKKQPFIAAAQKQNEANIANYQEANKEAVAAPVDTDVSKLVIRKKMKFPNEPKKPPASGYQLYNVTHQQKLSHFSQKQKPAEMKRLWEQLDEKSKQSFSMEAQNMAARYKKEVKKYIKTLPADMAAQYELQRKLKLVDEDGPPAKKSKIESIADEAEESDDGSDDSSSSSDDDDSDSDSSDSNNESNSSSSDDEASSSSNED